MLVHWWTFRRSQLLLYYLFLHMCINRQVCRGKNDNKKTCLITFIVLLVKQIHTKTCSEFASGSVFVAERWRRLGCLLDA
uniref:Putative secreted protein n=1 Tax=Ixodes ricinus TaxID=34613 RepID=A0A6B0U7G0_IXORI